jgi:chemotaxis protein histidine kinase CheA
MDNEQTATTLEKAASAHSRIEKIRKAVTAHHEKMTSLHKAHHTDILSALDGLDKVIGGSETNSPKAPEGSAGSTGGTDPVKVGLVPAGATENLVTFDKAAQDAQAAAVQKAVDAGVNKALEGLFKAMGIDPKDLEKAAKKGDSSSSSSSSSSSAPKKAHKAAKPADSSSSSSSSRPAVKAAKPADSSSSSSSSSSPSRPKKAHKGVGDRMNIHPQGSNRPVMKGMEGGAGMPDLQSQRQIAKGTTIDASIVEKAMNGDAEARALLFKGVTAQDSIPDTVIGHLSKVN